MARPTKNSCDYFPHDAGMRKHRKIMAIRQKFGLIGFALWVMLLELLTEADGNEIEHSDVEIELIAGDFGTDCQTLEDLIQYSLKLELLFKNDMGFINSVSLDDRLAPVYVKRQKAKEISERQKRVKGQFSKDQEQESTENTEGTAIPVTETPQSKEENSKVNKTKKEKTTNTNPQAELICPFSVSFLNNWNTWKEYKKSLGKAKAIKPQYEQKALDFLVKDSNGSESVAIEMIDRAITNGWQSLYYPKGANSPAQEPSGNGRVTIQRDIISWDVKDEFRKVYELYPVERKTDFENAFYEFAKAKIDHSGTVKEMLSALRKRIKYNEYAEARGKDKGFYPQTLPQLKWWIINKEWLQAIPQDADFERHWDKNQDFNPRQIQWPNPINLKGFTVPSGQIKQGDEPKKMVY
jgi:hypothetical protein